MSELIQWEYLTAFTNIDYPMSHETMEVYGRSGWELVSTLKNKAEIVYYFKRPKITAPTKQEPQK